MTWLKLDDGFPEHAKVVAAGGDAAWLHVCALAYASRNLTDGFIPAGVLGRLSDRRQPARLATRLVDAGLWDIADDGWMIHDYLEYQPSRAKVLHQREEARERMAKNRGSSKDVHANNEGSSLYKTRQDKTPPPLVTSPNRQTLPTGEQVGLSVEAHQAFDIYAAHVYERNPGKCTGDKDRYIAGVRKRAIAERVAEIRAYTETHPDATIYDLCRNVLGLNDLDLHQAGYYRKGA